MLGFLPIKEVFPEKGDNVGVVPSKVARGFCSADRWIQVNYQSSGQNFLKVNSETNYFLGMLVILQSGHRYESVT